MAKTTFGDELRKMMKSRKLSAAKLSRLMKGDYSSNKTSVDRWLKFGKKNSKTASMEDESLRDIVKGLNKARPLSFADEVYLYGLAGKIPPTRMPSMEQIAQVLEELAPALERFPYPAYVLDLLNFRFWMINPPTIMLIGGPDRVGELANCSVFQLLFSPRYGISDLFGESLELNQAEQIRRFKAVNILRRHEEFYMAYPETLRDENLLTAEEYAAFERLWNEINHDTKPAPYFDASTLKFDLGGYHFEFHLKVENVLDLGDLFSISWFDLKSQEFEEEAKAFFSSGQHRACIKIWELPGVDRGMFSRS